MPDIIKKSTDIPVVQEIKKESNKEIARKFLKQYISAPCDPEVLLQNLGKAIKEYDIAENKKDLEKQLTEKANEALPIMALDTHYILARAVFEEMRPFAIEFANQLTVEYECKTPTEKALAETVAAAYLRIMQFTQVMTRQMRDEHCSMIQNGFYKVASQELDRANRHFTSAIAMLKQLKSPTMTVQVKATTAFVSQNQQINAIPNDQTSNNTNKIYEIIDPN